MIGFRIPWMTEGLLLDLALKLHYTIQQGFRPGRTTGYINIHRYYMIYSPNNRIRIIIEGTA